MARRRRGRGAREDGRAGRGPGRGGAGRRRAGDEGRPVSAGSTTGGPETCRAAPALGPWPAPLTAGACRRPPRRRAPTPPSTFGVRRPRQRRGPAGYRTSIRGRPTSPPAESQCPSPPPWRFPSLRSWSSNTPVRTGGRALAGGP